MTTLIKAPVESAPTAAVEERPEDVIRELATVVVREWRITAACLVVAIACGAAVYFTATPLYRSTVVLQVGRLGVVGDIENPNLLIVRIGEKYSVGNKDLLKKNGAYLEQANLISSKSGAESVVMMAGVSQTPEMAQKLVTDISEEIINTHKQLCDWIIQDKRRQIDVLSAQIKAAQEEQSNIDSRLSGGKGFDPTVAMLMTTQRASLFDVILKMIERRSALELELSDIRTGPTTFLRTPNLPMKPFTPNTMAIGLMSVAIGLLSGVFISILRARIFRPRSTLARP